MTYAEQNKSLAECRGEYIRSLLKPGSRPNSAVATFRAAIPSPEFLGQMPENYNIYNKHSTPCAELAAWPGKIGIIAVNDQGYNAGNAAKDLAQTMYALGADVSGYGCIVGLLKNNLMQDNNGPCVPYQPDVAHSLGFEIVYDVDNLLGQGSIDVTNGVLMIGEGCVFFDSEKIAPNPQIDALIKSETLRAMANIASKHSTHHFSYFDYSYLNDEEKKYALCASNVPELVRTLSFGQWEYERGEKEHHLHEAPRNRNGISLRGVVDEALVKRFEDICLIWKGTLEQFGVDFDLEKFMLAGKMDALGEGLGVDSAVKAYLSGVPVADVLG